MGICQQHQGQQAHHTQLYARHGGQPRGGSVIERCGDMVVSIGAAYTIVCLGGQDAEQCGTQWGSLY